MLCSLLLTTLCVRFQLNLLSIISVQYLVSGSASKGGDVFLASPLPPQLECQTVLDTKQHRIAHRDRPNWGLRLHPGNNRHLTLAREGEL